MIVVGILAGAGNFSFLWVRNNCGAGRFVIVNCLCGKVTVYHLTAAGVLAAGCTDRWEHFT